MALTRKANGSQTLTATTEYTLDTEGDAGSYCARFNLENMADGDQVTIRMKTKVNNGNYGVQWKRDYFDDLGEFSVVQTPVCDSMDDLQVTIQRTGGSSFAVPWELLQYDG